MRAVARSYVYWPSIDDSIANLVRSCNECALAAKTNTRVKLESWPVPEKPWQRLHIDYAGPVDDWYYLVLVDAFTKWPEVVPTRRITTAATLEILQGIFARFGMPETLVSDNGRQFVSEQFERYCDNNGILHLKTPPFHPQSNGLAERFVDTFKRTLKKITAGGEGLSEAINTFLLCYRSTPNRSAPEEKSPAELLLGRPLRTSLDLLKPPTAFHKVEREQDNQFNRKHGAKIIVYNPKDLVWAKIYKNNNWSWEAGQVLERVGNVVYNVWLEQKKTLIRSHCNQLRNRYESETPNTTVSENYIQVPLDILLDTWGLNQRSAEAEAPQFEPDLPEAVFHDSIAEEPLEKRSRLSSGSQRRQQRPPKTVQQQLTLPRHSLRKRKVPVRYDPFHLY